MKNETKFLVVSLIGLVLLSINSTIAQCSTERNKNQLTEIIERQKKLIEKYKQFEDISIQIYINQVDSTGDTFDGSDDGVLFWNTLSQIDSLKNLKQFHIFYILSQTRTLRFVRIVEF